MFLDSVPAVKCWSLYADADGRLCPTCHVSCCFPKFYTWVLHFEDALQFKIELIFQKLHSVVLHIARPLKNTFDQHLVNMTSNQFNYKAMINKSFKQPKLMKMCSPAHPRSWRRGTRTPSLLVASDLVLWAVLELCFQHRYHKHPMGEFKATRSGFTKPDSSTNHHDSRGYDVWFIFPCCFYIH